MSHIKLESKVIVWGGNHHNTLGIIRSLGLKNIKSYLILSSQNKYNYIVKSKYVYKSWIVNNEKEGLYLLLNNFKSESRKPIIYSCSDKVASIIDSNYDLLSSRYILQGICLQGEVNRFMNKALMTEIAKNNGFNTIKTALVTMSNIANDLPYPCITKPLYSKSGSKSEIIICSCYDELKEYLSINPSNKILVQQYISKAYEFQLIGCSLNSGDNVIISGVTEILRSSQTTNTGVLRLKSIELFQIKLNNYIKQTNDFIKEMKYSGLFSIEFLVDNNNNVYFLEINLRNDGNSYVITEGGVNLPYIWYLESTNQNFKSEPLKINKQLLAIPELDDFFYMLRGKVKFTKWLTDQFCADIFFEYSKHDKKPFYYLLMFTIFSILNKIKLKIQNIFKLDKP